LEGEVRGNIEVSEDVTFSKGKSI